MLIISSLFLCLPPPLTPTLFFFTDPATSQFYTLSLHDALPICLLPPCRSVRFRAGRAGCCFCPGAPGQKQHPRSEEHTSEFQSHVNLVCRLLLEKKKKKNKTIITLIKESICITKSVIS